MKLQNSSYEFNNGLKTKFAYQIDKVYKLKEPISLKNLKEKCGFTPPQSYAYSDRYRILSFYIESALKELVWKRKDNVILTDK